MFEIFQKLKDKDNLHDLCLAWQLLHICRPENAVEMEWHEIENLDTNAFEISADKMKGGTLPDGVQNYSSPAMIFWNV